MASPLASPTSEPTSPRIRSPLVEDSNKPRMNRLLSMKYNQRSQLTFDSQGLYGPKAKLWESLPPPERKELVNVMIEDPGCGHHLWWVASPDAVLIMKKFKDPEVTKKFKELCSWIIEGDRMNTIVVEPSILEDPLVTEDDDFKNVRAKFKTWNDNAMSTVLRKVDLIICLGGDGTLLYTSSLFTKAIPPIMSISMGSLGFLTPFSYDSYPADIKRILNGGVSLTLRHRLDCKVMTKDKIDQYHGETCPMEAEEFLAPTVTSKFSALSLNPTNITIDKETESAHYLVMNEVVVDRGPSPYITNLEVFCNGRLITTVQADGIIVATPTGSTAYALAAGASVVHPSTPSMVICPICPHSLSFRPVVVPSGVEISIRVSSQARNSAWASFDGRNRTEIKHGESVVITTATSPVPSINNTGHVTDWFDSLAGCLHWNVREVQKGM
ncbi:NAD kinase-like [Dysidea avara]|uniref:NAD kinase-like n=1 Tax=Dysidea avara TaxID=196820 RepID=UPI003334A4D5